MPAEWMFERAEIPLEILEVSRANEEGDREFMDVAPGIGRLVQKIFDQRPESLMIDAGAFR